MVAAAGPLSNMLVASVASLPIHLGLATWHSPFLIVRTNFWDAGDYAGLFVASLVIFNIFLAVFNLLPISPLDGFAVFAGLLPRDLSLEFRKLEPYGPAILMALIFMGFFTGGQISPCTKSWRR
jgi:Zn-dependent protease